jgi:prepilin-type N-terminal cleavage/methylation domain-containing protein
MTVRKPPRPGFSLIEMVLAMGALAIVLGINAGLLHLLIRLDRAGRSHAAGAAKVDAEGRRIALTLGDDRSATYEAQDDSPLVRTEYHRTAVARRESYAFHSPRAVRFSAHDHDGHTWATLRFPTHPAPEPRGESVHPDLTIDALLARDDGRRHANGEEAQR